VFCGRDRVAVGRIHHDHATNRCCGDVDVVDTDAGTSDDTQTISRVQNIRGDFSFTANDKTFATAQCFAQFRGLEPGTLLDRETRRAQWSKTTFAHIIRHEYLCRHVC
jgi:hypothetical protein